MASQHMNIALIQAFQVDTLKLQPLRNQNDDSQTCSSYICFFLVLRYATSMPGKLYEFANLKERDWAEIALWLCSSISTFPFIIAGKNLRCNSSILTGKKDC